MNSTETVIVDEQQAQAAALAIRGGGGQPGHYMLLGWFLDQRGDRQGAQALFQEALERAPHDAIAHLALAKVLRESGKLRQAALHCDAAIAIAPNEPEAWYGRGLVMMEGGAPSEAHSCFTAALDLAEEHAGALAALALVEARAGNALAAQRHALAALVHDKQNATALCALAVLALEAGDHAAALASLNEALVALPQASAERISILTLIGEGHDKAGASDLAEQAYQHANREFLAANGAGSSAREPQAARIQALRRGFNAARAAHPSAWLAPEPRHIAGLRPVFVLGHPRSGNTLLENVLATIPGASAVEERPTLRAAERRFLSEAGMAELAAVSPGEIEALRIAYGDAATQNGGDVEAPLFVDMDPLKSLSLPIIARLFPWARVLLVLRDPRDIVWSCYRTHFALTNAALDFATLEGAARHYTATMELVETVRSALPLAIHAVRYEDLVTSFDETTRDIADFLEIPWQEDFRRFDKAARLRGVTTASERQVRQGLFDGRRQWQAHAEFMKPVEAILAPWVERFGYAASAEPLG